MRRTRSNAASLKAVALASVIAIATDPAKNVASSGDGSSWDLGYGLDAPASPAEGCSQPTTVARTPVTTQPSAAVAGTSISASAAPATAENPTTTAQAKKNARGGVYIKRDDDYTSTPSASDRISSLAPSFKLIAHHPTLAEKPKLEAVPVPTVKKITGKKRRAALDPMHSHTGVVPLATRIKKSKGPVLPFTTDQRSTNASKRVKLEYEHDGLIMTRAANVEKADLLPAAKTAMVADVTVIGCLKALGFDWARAWTQEKIAAYWGVSAKTLRRLVNKQHAGGNIEVNEQKLGPKNIITRIVYGAQICELNAKTRLDSAEQVQRNLQPEVHNGVEVPIPSTRSIARWRSNESVKKTVMLRPQVRCHAQ